MKDTTTTTNTTNEEQDPRWSKEAMAIGEDLHKLNVEYGSANVEPYLKFTIKTTPLTMKKLDTFKQALRYMNYLFGHYYEGFDLCDSLDVPSALNVSYRCYLSATTLVEDIKVNQGLALEEHQLEKLTIDLYKNLMRQGSTLEASKK